MQGTNANAKVLNAIVDPARLSMGKVGLNANTGSFIFINLVQGKMPLP